MARTKKSRKAKLIQKRKAKKKASAAAASAAGGAAEEDAQSAAERAIQWLQQWQASQGSTAENGAWKFSKTRQSFLLRSWQHRARVPGDAFKVLLLYLRTLPETTRERTLSQAREVQEAAEAAEAALLPGDDVDDDDDERLEEQRALLKIRRARALKVIQALVGGGADAADAGPPGAG